MPSYDYDIGIIGGGSAGLTAASGASQLGAKTLLIEREPKLGGDCLHYGCVPSKTLIKTAKVYHQMKNAEKYGLPGVKPGPVDFRQVAARIRNVIDTIQVHDSPERFCKLGAEVKFGRPEFVDDHTVDLDGKRISAARWLIATGSEPSAPPFPGLADCGYLTNREIFYLDALPKSLTVLGGGPIAIEMAQAFARLGSQVTVIQRSKQILSKEDPDLAEELLCSLEEEGLKFHLGTKVKMVRSVNSGKEVIIEKDGSELAVRGGEILVALGRAPNVTELGLEDAGVGFTPKGIPVDERMRTNQKHIFAAGDCTGKYLFTHAAGYEGGIFISNAVFRLPRKADYTWLPWCTYCEPELASIGMNEKRAQEAGIEYKVWSEQFSANDRALAENDKSGRIKMLVDAREKPIGVQILGPGAGDLLSEWVAALNGGVKLSTLAGAVHPYPTLAEINKRVVGSMFSEKIFSDKMKKGLAFLFHYKGRACTPSGEG